MGQVADWRLAGLFKADPDKVAAELKAIGNPTVDAMIEYAKDEATELHKCFEWNDSIAGEKYRRFQATQIRIHLVYKKQDGEREYVPIRVINKASETEWKPTEIIIKHESEYKYMLRRALMELKVFQQKYATLKELDELLEIISQYTAELDSE